MFRKDNNPVIKFTKISFSLIIASISIIGLTLISFRAVGNSIIEKLNKESGSVAGAQTQNEGNYVDDSIKESVPLMPNSNIISTDTQNGKTSFIIESSRQDSEITGFYENFFISNGWKKTEDDQYTKRNQILTLNVNNGIIQITIE